MLETAAPRLFGGDTRKGNQFLLALAHGADHAWPRGTNPARTHAGQLRSELIAVVGAQVANALFRCVSRDGRLYPGLAPPTDVHDHVDSEKNQLTPATQVADWFSGVPAEEIRRRHVLGEAA